MSYQTQAAAAKSMARDILRTEMALRIQERATKAQAALTSAVKNLVAVTADQVKQAARIVKMRADDDAEIAAYGQALGTIEGLTPDEITAVSAELATEAARLVTERSENDEAIAKSNADQIKHAQDKIDAARAEYE